MDNVDENFSVQLKKEQLSKSQADDAAPQNAKKKKRFPDITSKECDEIAGQNIKEKTRKQTVWGVKVFRGNNFSVKNLQNQK